MDENKSAITVDDWKRAADQVIKLSERAEASVPVQKEENRGAGPRLSHSE